MWLPPDLERFLVMRSGLLPREAKDSQSNTWRVYTNVPAPIAAVICEKLGHSWGIRPKDQPQQLTNLEFS